MNAEILAFEMPDADARNEGEQALIVDVEGFEGPLDLLLMLARQQKVDLAKISILALANQYLRFVEQARQKRLELAADYLVMAAWLAYLKSRLLLPVAASADGPSAEDLASSFALRLKRLEVFRAAATQMMERPQLGREIFARGAPEPIRDVKKAEYSASLYDLLSAYALQRQKHALNRVRFEPRKVWSLVEARNALDRFMRGAPDWSRLDRFLLDYGIDPKSRATALASSFAVALEMVREGQLEMQQNAALSPLYLRKRIASDEPGTSPN